MDKLEETGANVSDAIAEGAQLQSLKDNLGHLRSPVMAVSLVLKIGQHDLMIQHKKNEPETLGRAFGWKLNGNILRK